eukprot:4861854-Prymnesium_polylepis.2
MSSYAIVRCSGWRRNSREQPREYETRRSPRARHAPCPRAPRSRWAHSPRRGARRPPRRTPGPRRTRAACSQAPSICSSRRPSLAARVPSGTSGTALPSTRPARARLKR